MSNGATAGAVSMKGNNAFLQANSQLQKTHTQDVLQHASVFDQQFQLQHQQHLLQQQQQQLQHNQNQHAQLHRLSQHQIPSIHPVQSSIGQTNPANHAAHSNVFSNAEFFHTLQQTAAAAALPTVLPYDQSQYIGQLMYFPYPTAAAAAANGLFNATPTGDIHHMSVGTSIAGAQATLINQTSGNTGQLLGGQGIVSASHGGLVTLNNTGISAQVPNANQLFAHGTNLVGIGNSNANSISGVTNVTQASLAPLFTTTHFYPQHAQQLNGQQQQQLQLQHHSQTSIPMQQIQSLAGSTNINFQQQQQQQQRQSAAAAVLLSTSGQSTQLISNQSGLQQLTQLSTQLQVQQQQSLVNTNCENLQKSDDKTQTSGSAHTPQKQYDQELPQSNQLSASSQGNNSSIDASLSGVKRDNSGTGHFV